MYAKYEIPAAINELVRKQARSRVASVFIVNLIAILAIAFSTFVAIDTALAAPKSQTVQTAAVVIDKKHDPVLFETRPGLDQIHTASIETRTGYKNLFLLLIVIAGSLVWAGKQVGKDMTPQKRRTKTR